MKKFAASVFLICIISTSLCFSDALNKDLYSVLSAYVSGKDGRQLLESKKCSNKARNDGSLIYSQHFQRPIGKKDIAYLVELENCETSSFTGSQYLIIRRGERYNVITDIQLGEHNFWVSSMPPARGNNIILYGQKWEKDDPHCCPSREGTLSYNLDTGKISFSPQ